MINAWTCLDYMSVKDDQLIFRCFECKNDSKAFMEFQMICWMSMICWMLDYNPDKKKYQ